MKRETETERKKKRRSQWLGYEERDGRRLPPRALKKKKKQEINFLCVLPSRCNLNDHRGEETPEHQREIMSQQRRNAKQQYLIGAAGDPLAVSKAAGLIPALDLHYPASIHFPGALLRKLALSYL